VIIIKKDDMETGMIVERMKKGTVTITNDTELHARIMHLNSLRAEQELAIKRNVKEIAYSMHPSVMIKNAIKKFSDPEQGESQLKDLGLAFGGDFLLSKVFGKGVTLKGFVGQFLVKKVINYVVNNHSDTIKNGLSKLENFVREKKAA
jgi:hypothetical protein